MLQINDNSLPGLKKSQKATIAELRYILNKICQKYQTGSNLNKTQDLILVAIVIETIESNLELKKQIVHLLNEVESETLRQEINHRLASILIAAIQDWRENSEQQKYQ